MHYARIQDLIIDDEEANVILLECMLQRAGYTNLSSLTDSRETLKLDPAAALDLVLLDLSMPSLDGFAVMKHLRDAQPPGSYLPILVLTADITLQTKRRALAGGATDFLTKPFENDEVLLRCKNLLEARRLHVALQNQNQELETKVRERTRDLEQTMAELQTSQRQNVRQERLRALGEMSAGVAHDFNNQLTVMMGYSDLLLLNNAQMLNNRLMATRYLQTISTAAHDSAHIVARLRDFYRPRDQEEIFLAVDLQKLVKEAAALSRPKWKDQARADGRQITVRAELEPVPPVAGNAAELREAVTNLIFNAVDAMPDGGTITLRARRGGEFVIVEVADTGSGMTEEVYQRCLEPFFTTKGEAGTGLGLSMVYGIVQRHEGRMDIFTAPGHGTTFTIRLPLQGEVLGRTLPVANRMQKPLRVLVVEDDPAVRAVVTEYLRRDNHEVSTAVNGVDGLRQYESGVFDLVVTDLAMDEMNGEMLADAIKAHSGGVPVILLTGFADSLAESDRKMESIDVVVRKPLGPGDLWRAVAQAMTLPAAEPPAGGGAALPGTRAPGCEPAANVVS